MVKSTKLKLNLRERNSEVEDQDFILFNDKEDEREAINSLQYFSSPYLGKDSEWKNFYD